MLKKLLKDARYNPNSKRFDVPEITLNRSDKRTLFLEGKLYGYDQQKVSELVREVLDKGIKFSTSIKKERSVLPTEIKMEQHFKIEHLTDNRTNIDEFLKIGKRKYLLINHDRGSLLPGTVLKTKTSPWQVGSFIEFVVVLSKTENKPTQTIYKTGEIISISFVKPSELYQYLEHDGVDYQRKLYAVFPNKENGFGHEVLSLEKSDEMYYEIEQDGNDGFFQPIPSSPEVLKKTLENMETIIIPACQTLNQPSANTKSIVVEEKGELAFVKDCWTITKKAKIKFSDQVQ
ncbi:MAG: hypothetical protein AAF985_11895 [Bacteroidota bacterium]